MKNYYKITHYIIVLIGVLVFFLFHFERGVEAKADETHLQPIPFSIVATIIGGVIILTLTYVSWRKYKAEKKREDKNENS